jgi:hypothetical protein
MGLGRVAFAILAARAPGYAVNQTDIAANATLRT